MVLATGLEFAEVEVEPALAVQLAGHSGSDSASIAQAMCTAFATLKSFVARHHLAVSGPPRAIYNAYDAAGVSFTVALPVAADSLDPAEASPVWVGVLPPLKAYRFAHRGPYSGLAQTYGHITEFLKEKGRLKSNADWVHFMPMWEEFQNDPETTPPADLLTYIYLPAASGAARGGA